jgi:manganese/zinc/iron transport system permease protein
VTGVIGVLCIQAILRNSRLREDAAIGIVLSVFFGAGIVALSYIQKDPGGNAAGLNKFIYGQTAAMSIQDAFVMGGIALAAALAAGLLLKELTLVCFNDAFAKVDGWPVSVIDLIMMALVVLVTVAGLQAVGLILVVAMLIIPAVSARFWTDRLWLLVLLAALIGGLSGYLGSAVSALLPRKPAGSVIVLTAGCIFAVSLICAPARGVVAVWLRRALLRIRIEGEHVLEAAHERAEESGAPARLEADELDRVARLRGWSWWFRPLVMLNLRRRGQARVSAGAVELTDAGRRRGSQVSRNHSLWEQYLVSYADIAPSHVDWSVDMVEHVLSEDLVAELEAALAKKRGADLAGAPS